MAVSSKQDSDVHDRIARRKSSAWTIDVVRAFCAASVPPVQAVQLRKLVDNGIAATFWMNGILLGVAAYVTLQLPSQSPHREHLRGLARWWKDRRAGLHAKWTISLERGWTLVNFLVWIFQGPAVGMLIPLKVESLGLSGLWLGGCEAALSIGLLIGSFRGSDALVSRFGRFNVRVGAAMCEGLALAASGWAPSPLVLVLALTCVGFANAAMGLVGRDSPLVGYPAEFPCAHSRSQHDDHPDCGHSWTDDRRRGAHALGGGQGLYMLRCRHLSASFWFCPDTAIARILCARP